MKKIWFVVIASMICLCILPVSLAQSEEVVFPQVYEGIQNFCQNDRYGYITQEGFLITEAVCDAPRPFMEGHACVSIDGQWGYIDHSGEFYTEDSWTYANEFSDGLAIVETEDKWICIDENYQHVFSFDDEEYLYESNFENGYLLIKKDGYSNDEPESKYGIVNRNGIITVQCDLDECFFGDGVMVFEKDGFYGAMDGTGNLLVPAEYECGEWPRDGIILLSNGNTFYGFSCEGRQLFVLEDVFVFPFAEGMARVMDLGPELYEYYIDDKGNMVSTIEETYGLGDFSEGLAEVCFCDGTKGYVNQQGQTVIKGNYEKTSQFDGGVALVCIQGSDCYISHGGSIVFSK